MRLGIDLDNTIISYDSLFAQLAMESGIVPPDVATNKKSIRDYLRSQEQEDRWTELQGIAYGSRIEEAVPFPGVHDFFLRCSKANVEWWIISHRTEYPYRGAPVDLHNAAQQWLIRRGFVVAREMGNVKLETSREGKLRTIAQTNCDVFIDDLPEMLCDPVFPPRVRRILFDPSNQNADRAEYERAMNWAQIAGMLHI
jgi:hypothetical protein